MKQLVIACIRILRCVLHVSSPSLVTRYLHGFPSHPTGWLSRWEHRIARREAERWMGKR
jgi:hypothetical protein